METASSRSACLTLFLKILFWIYWVGTVSAPFGYAWVCFVTERSFFHLLVLLAELFCAIGLCFSSAILVKSDPRLAQLGLITLGLVLTILFVMGNRGVLP